MVCGPVSNVWQFLYYSFLRYLCNRISASAVTKYEQCLATAWKIIDDLYMMKKYHRGKWIKVSYLGNVFTIDNSFISSQVCVGFSFFCRCFNEAETKTKIMDMYEGWIFHQWSLIVSTVRDVAGSCSFFNIPHQSNKTVLVAEKTAVKKFSSRKIAQICGADGCHVTHFMQMSF